MSDTAPPVSAALPGPDAPPKLSANAFAPGYDAPEYVRQRQAKLQLIPTNAFLDAISRNAWTVTTGLMMAATGAVATNQLTLAIGLLVTAVAISTIGAVSGYFQDKLMKPAELIFGEVRQVADAKVAAKETALALTETLGKELKENRDETHYNAQAIAELKQDVKHWQERVALNPENASRSVH